METEGSTYETKYSFRDVAERSAEESAIDDWLPVGPSRRTGKWWYSAVHNITVIVGAGVLGLPYAMAEMGWGPGITFLVISWLVTLYSLWQMVQMHEIAPGKRFDRYHELGQHAFGEKLGLWIVVPQQLIVVVGVDIVYMITGGQCLKKFHHLLHNFNSIVRVSLAAAVMSVSYSTIAWGASGRRGVQPDVRYGYKSKTTAGRVFDFFSALGSIIFAYGGHNVVMEIQATMPSTPRKPSKEPMWRGAFVAYVVVALCYFPVAVAGYLVFGNEVDENILITLHRPRWLVATANMFVVVHLIGGYQAYAMPVFDMMESLLVMKLKFTATWRLRFVTRNIYVALTMLVAISFPFFGGVLGFIGGFALAPTTYFLPCIIWLCIHKPGRFTISWLINWVCIILGVLLMVIAPIGGLRQIIIQAKTYKFYS
ncbi:lysine histidine transporter 1-like isoform X2 [Andrographis paniculata]|uniref:lysine histidine transporter 1-like isoform X2 n=1 Tax=Andrographis paniculata TaxID=175694 RepID=UPI0021E85ADD|nr:lysine histidine transporter 1-like isoform X2 [Andrographis paniculata]